MSKCSCGRSPTGLCVGWHSLTEEKYEERKKKYEELSEEEKKKKYEQLNEDEKKEVFHPRAIDGFGE